MILTSSLYESIKLVKKFLNEKTASKKILFIPTATNVDGYKKYIHLTQKVFEDFGYEVENFDISAFPEEVAKKKLLEAEIVFISGGNTFYLLQELKKKNLISYLKERIGKGLIYIGESAGSVITAPNIEYVSVMDDKTLAEELDDYTGLNLVDFYILPHYNNFPFKKATNKIFELYSTKLSLRTISNDEVILVDNDKIEVKSK